jgi:hypothetical protein
MKTELQRGNFVLDELAHMVNANVKLIGLTFMYSNLFNFKHMSKTTTKKYKHSNNGKKPNVSGDIVVVGYLFGLNENVM